VAAKVYIVGRPYIDWWAVSNFLKAETGDGLSWQRDAEEGDEIRTVYDGQELCELAGRVCYMSFGESQGRKTNKHYLDNILSSGHGSVLEHANWNVIVTGISRTCSHELVRHRAGWSYSQLSQRYVDESQVEVVMPSAIASLGRDAQRAWEADMRDARETYKHWADVLQKAQPADMTTREARLAARQAARSVLPNATETKIFITANCRALRHFFTLRGSLAAEPEIRALAHQWLPLMHKESPHLFGDLQIVDGAITCVS